MLSMGKKLPDSACGPDRLRVIIAYEPEVEDLRGAACEPTV